MQSVVRDGSTLSIYVLIPSVPANTGTTSISLSISGFETPISVPWEVIDDSQAYIASVFPQEPTRTLTLTLNPNPNPNPNP